MASMPGENKNALEMLMSGSRKRRRQTQRWNNSGTRFVLCPVGCGLHVLEKNINSHIDECLVAQHQKRQDVEPMVVAVASPDGIATHKLGEFASESTAERQPSSNDESAVKDTTCETFKHLAAAVSQESLPKTPSRFSRTEEIDPSEPIVVSAEKKQLDVVANDTHVDDDLCESPEKLTAAVHMACEKRVEAKRSGLENTSTNVFSRMMRQSKTIFATPRKIVHCQTLHLNSNGTVALYFHQYPQKEQITWSTSLVIKDRARDAADNCSRQTELSVTLSSSFPGRLGPSPRLVRHHSRLSVPVLKSILQKSIRRRRPLPAVRVAMELADKSTGDLLRRLPVIILEDSTLHPDMFFLVWLMMAGSKGYQIPLSLLIRVMSIVFEVASCQWIDRPKASSLSSSSTEGDGLVEASKTSEVCTLSLLTETSPSDPDTGVDAECLVLWSILVRAEYGGMKSDVDMLRTFASTWMKRFRSDKGVRSQVSEDVKHMIQQPVDGKGVDDVLTWLQIVKRIHQRAHEQARLRVTTLCTSGLVSLSLSDATLQGVDVHCSNVIDHLVASNPSFTDLCWDLLDKPSEDGDIDRNSWLVNLLKRCMWDFSSGVNRRRPLLSTMYGTAAPELDNYKEFWDQLVLPKVTAFQKSYIEQRLVN